MVPIAGKNDTVLINGSASTSVVGRMAATPDLGGRQVISGFQSSTWSCDYCDLSFNTKIGLGVHKNHKHKELFDIEKAQSSSSSQNVSSSSKRRWSQDEDMVLAKLVLSLHDANPVLSRTELNNTLAMKLRGRSAEAINCRRKSQTFKKLIDSLKRAGHGVEHNFNCFETDGGHSDPLNQEEQNDGGESVEEPRVFNRDEANLVHSRSVSPDVSNRVNNITMRHVGESSVSQSLTEEGRSQPESGQVDSVILAKLKKDTFELLSKIRSRLRKKESKLYRVKQLARCLKQPRGHPSVEGDLNEWLNTVTARGKLERPRRYTYQEKRKFTIEQGSEARREGKQRTAEHAYIQSLYNKKGAKGVANYIFADMDDEASNPSAETNVQKEIIDPQAMTKYWSDIYKGSPENVREPLTVDDYNDGNSQTNSMMDMISYQDIKRNEPKPCKGVGLDGVTPKTWRSIPGSIRALFYNVVLYHGIVLERLAKARTVFIKKSNCPTSPSEFRPISITSVILRQFHRILATRLNEVCPSSRDQVAFKSTDGVAINLVTLQTVIEHSRTNQKELHVASMDLRKAFDSVKHSAIIEMVKNKGLPKEFIEYLITYYSNAETQLEYGGVFLNARIGQGVFQGCPLSPILFNLVIDQALDALDDDFGYKLDKDTRIKCTAFADDVNIIGGSVAGTQLNINIFANKLSKIGLEANPGKCLALSSIVDGKNKRMFLDTNDKFTVTVSETNHHIKSITPSTEWKYLGLKFIGSKIDKRVLNIDKYFLRIDRALLNPQQKLDVLNQIVLPQWVHITTFSNACREELSSIDKTSRKWVRKWLHLPHDVPKAYLHAPVRTGGLGIFEFSVRIPVSRLRRIRRVINTSFLAASIQETKLFNDIKKNFEKLIDAYGVRVEDEDIIAKIYIKALDSKLCTMGLSNSYECRETRAWVKSKSHKVAPSEFIKYNLISSNSLPSLARRNWGRRDTQNVNCRHGCPHTETAHHILQECTLTHGMRVRRHDRFLDLIMDGLTHQQGQILNIEKEPQFITRLGMRKPDLVISSANKEAFVIDAHVVGRFKIGEKNAEKASKYRSIPGFTKLVKERFGVEKVTYKAITVSYTGIMEKSSAKLLLKLGLSKTFIHMMTTSILRGSWFCWAIFNRRYRTYRERIPVMGSGIR